MGVVLYHIWAGDRDEFTEDYDDARRIFAEMTNDYAGSGMDVHLHVEEYDSEEDYEADRMSAEDCLMTTAHGGQLEAV